MTMKLATLLAATFGAAAAAQVPFDYLVTVENGTNTSPGMRFVEPSTGVATDVEPVPGARATIIRAQTVATDPQQPASILYAGGLSTSIAPTFHRAGMQGNQVAALTNHNLQGARALPVRLEVAGSNVLVTIGTGTSPGLWQAPSTGGTATLLAPLTGAFDVAVGGNFAWVNGYAAGRPTQIEEVDLRTNTVRTLGSSYPAARALLFSGSALLVGTDTGDLLSVDTVTGAILSQVNLFPAAVVALTTTSGGRVYALSEFSEIHDVAALGTPVYRSAQQVNDIAAGTVDLASFLLYGDGCGPSGGPVPYQSASGVPSLGNSSFAVALLGGRPSVPALVVLGTSRTTYAGLPLPLRLDFLGMTGCSLYTDVVATLPTALDASGNGSLPLPIPNAPRLRGRHLTTQWFAVDLVANPAGVVATDGGEAILR